MVAFLASLFILAILILPIFPYAKRRPKGTVLTWGEAMAAAVYSFFIMFWAYGTVPHLWLGWTSDQLNWRPDNLLYQYEVWGKTPFGIVQPQEAGGSFPVTITMQTIRDIVAVLIYIVFLGGQMWLWAYWQKRGDKPTVEVATSEYGRPLVRQG